MNDYDNFETQAHQSKQFLMPWGLHLVLLAETLFGLEMFDYFGPLQIYDYVNPLLLFYPISFLLAGLLYLAFEKISVWIWVFAGVLNPIVLFFGIMPFLILLVSPAP